MIRKFTDNRGDIMMRLAEYYDDIFGDDENIAFQDQEKK